MKVELYDGKRQVLVKKEFLYAMSIFFASHYMLSSLQISCGSTSDQKMFTESSPCSGQVHSVHPCLQCTYLFVMIRSNYKFSSE